MTPLGCRGSPDVSRSVERPVRTAWRQRPVPRGQVRGQTPGLSPGTGQGSDPGPVPYRSQSRP